MNEVNFFYIDEKCKFLINLNIKEILNAIILHFKRFVGFKRFFFNIIEGLKYGSHLAFNSTSLEQLERKRQNQSKKIKIA